MCVGLAPSSAHSVPRRKDSEPGFPIGILQVELDASWPVPLIRAGVVATAPNGSVAAGLFAVNPVTRVISLQGRLDFETWTGFTLNVTVSAAYAAGSVHVGSPVMTSLPSAYLLSPISVDVRRHRILTRALCLT